MSLSILSICHLLVDGISASLLFQEGAAPAVAIILIYNTCAFTTQCLMGMLPDKYGHGKVFVMLSSLILLCGVLIPGSLMTKAIIVGFGNSLFHVSGGYLTLKDSNNMWPLGIFVAPGAIGLFIGTNYNIVCLPFVLLLVILSVILLLVDKSGEERIAVDHRKEKVLFVTNNGKRIKLIAFLLFAVATRAIGGSVVSFPWKTGLILGVITVFCVFAGKIVGGIIADKYGINNTATVSIVFASILISFFNLWMIPSLIGQFALNISMPITLFLIYQLFPDSPGFAFGLAAAALWPGTLIGQAIQLTGMWSGMLTVLCFTIGLLAICITEKEIENEKDKNSYNVISHYDY